MEECCFCTFQTLHLKPLAEINMYRQSLFAVECDLLAYRYTDPIEDSEHYDINSDSAAIDAARMLKEAQRIYLLEQGEEQTDDFSSARFLQALRSVSFFFFIVLYKYCFYSKSGKTIMHIIIYYLSIFPSLL